MFTVLLIISFFCVIHNYIYITCPSCLVSGGRRAHVGYSYFRVLVSGDLGEEVMMKNERSTSLI